jgi:hypothetical protein
MKMIFSDHLQAWNKRYVVLLFVVTVSLNIYLLFQEENNINWWESATVSEYNSIYQELEAVKNEDCVAYLEEKQSLLSEDDYVLNIAYTTVINELRYVGKYDDYYQSLVSEQELKERISIFANQTAYEKADVNKTLAKLKPLAEKGTIVTANPSRGVKMILETRQTDIFALFLIILFCLSLYYYERENGAQSLFFTCRSGRSKYILSKIATLAILTIEIEAALYGGNAIAAIKLYGLGDLSRSIQSVNGYISCGLGTNVGETLLLYLVLKYLSYFIIALVTFLLMIYFKKMVSFVAACIIFFGGNYLLFTKISENSWLLVLKDLNYVSFMRVDRILSEYRNLNIGGTPVSYIRIYLIALCLNIIILPAWIVFAYKNVHFRNNVLAIRLNPKKWFKKAVQRGSNKSISIHGYSMFMQELKKILLYNHTGILIIIAAVIIVYTEPAITTIYANEDDIYYKQYIDEIQGEYSDEKSAWIDKQLEEFEELEEAYASDLAAATDDTEKNAIIIYYEKKLRGENAAYLLQSHSEHLEEISDGGFFYSRGYEKLTGGDIAGSDDQSHAVRLVIILLLLLFGVYSLDYSNNVMGLVKSTIKGRKPFNVSKYLIGLILVTITYFEIYGLWFYKIFHTYGVYGSSFSVCSMEHISEKFAQMTVLQYLIMISIIRYLSCIIIMLVMFWLQRKMKNPMAALIICIFVFLMPLLLYSSGISIMKYVGITPFLLGNL